MGTLSSLWYIIYIYTRGLFSRTVRDLVKNFTKSWNNRYLFPSLINKYYLASFGSSIYLIIY